MIRKLWLVFCQTATVCVAVLFVVTTLRPDLLSWTTRGGVVTIREAQPESVAYDSNSKQRNNAVLTILAEGMFLSKCRA